MQRIRMQRLACLLSVGALSLSGLAGCGGKTEDTAAAEAGAKDVQAKGASTGSERGNQLKAPPAPPP